MKEQDKMHPDRINQVHSPKFSEMNAVDKLKYFGKIIVFLVTGGFAFPNIFTD